MTQPNLNEVAEKACGFLDCPNETLGAELTVSFTDDFHIAVERQIKVCHSHAYAVLKTTREARGEPNVGAKT